MLGLIILGAVSSLASSQHLLKEISGEWVRVEGVSDWTLSIEISHDGLAIADHLDGEGYECTILSKQLHLQELASKARKLMIAFGAAVCRAEENK
jgi:hypothetical protein